MLLRFDARLFTCPESNTAILLFNVKKNPIISRFAISTYFFLMGLVFSSWASRIPSIKDKFNFDEAELGAVLFMLPFGALAALPISGWIVHKFGSKQISFVSLFVYSISLYCVAAVDTPTFLSIALFLFGFLGNMSNISMNTQGLSIQHLLNRPILSGLHAMWSVGAFSAAAVTGWMMHWRFSVDQQFLLITILGVVVSIVLYFFLVEDLVHEQPPKIIVLPTKSLLLLGFICFCVAMSEGAMADWSSLYYRMILNNVNLETTTGYTAFAFSMAIGRFIGDRLISHLGYKRLLMMNGFFITIGMTLALVFEIPLTVIIGFSLIGLGVSSVFPVVYMVASKNKSMAPAAALASVSSVGFTGFLLGPPIIGFVAHEIGLRLSLLIVIALGAIILLLTQWLKSDSD
jgi:MFS family permease